MNEDRENLLLKILNGALKIIVFPVYIIYYAVVKLLERKKISIRTSLTLIHLKIAFRSLFLTGLVTFLIFGVHKTYFVFENYNLITKNVTNAKKIEYETLEIIAGAKHYVFVYDKDKNILLYPLNDSKTSGRQANNAMVLLNKNMHKRFFSFVSTGNSRFVVLDKKIYLNGTMFYLNIYSDITEETKDIYSLFRIIFIVNTGGLVFALILSIILGRNVFLPIKEMTQAAKSISDKNMNVRLNVTGSKHELKDLAKTFNEMMDRIEDGYNRQRQFVQDASHELRTPIGVLQGYINMLDRWGKNDKHVLQESIDAIKNESENMKDLLEKLLFLARSDKGTLTLQKEEFNLSGLIEEIVKETEIIDKKHILNCNIKEEIYINADKNRIKQALRIFLDNAIKYTHENGEITLALNALKKYAVVEITDTGIGMSGEEIKHAFDRFYRSDKSRKREKGGHGLGLSIAKLIILSHKGRINVKSKIQKGTEIKVFLPFSL
jgi:two-component system sensor histidine kinase ArlS